MPLNEISSQEILIDFMSKPTNDNLKNSQMSRFFANGPGSWGSIPSRAIPDLKNST